MLSWYCCTAMAALVRLSMSPVAITTRSVAAVRARTVSPRRTGWAGFALVPLTFTWPARQAALAADRVG